MSEILNKLSGEELIPIVAIIAGIVCAIVAILSRQWRRLRVAEMEAGLKQQMLEKGMSAAEIAQVLRASSQRDCGHWYTGDENYDKGNLVKALADNGLSAEDIERVLRALHPAPANGQPTGAQHVRSRA
jgi:hypothetical protein